VAEVLIVVGQVTALIFVVCQMLAMGLVLMVPQIIEPLKNKRLVILALVGNFVLVPVVALALVSILPMSALCSANIPYLGSGRPGI